MDLRPGLGWLASRGWCGAGVRYLVLGGGRGRGGCLLRGWMAFGSDEAV